MGRRGVACRASGSRTFAAEAPGRGGARTTGCGFRGCFGPTGPLARLRRARAARGSLGSGYGAPPASLPQNARGLLLSAKRRTYTPESRRERARDAPVCARRSVRARIPGGRSKVNCIWDGHPSFASVAPRAPKSYPLGIIRVEAGRLLPRKARRCATDASERRFAFPLEFVPSNPKTREKRERFLNRLSKNVGTLRVRQIRPGHGRGVRGEREPWDEGALSQSSGRLGDFRPRRQSKSQRFSH